MSVIVHILHGVVCMKLGASCLDPFRGHEAVGGSGPDECGDSRRPRPRSPGETHVDVAGLAPVGPWKSTGGHWAAGRLGDGAQLQTWQKGTKAKGQGHESRYLCGVWGNVWRLWGTQAMMLTLVRGNVARHAYPLLTSLGEKKKKRHGFCCGLIRTPASKRGDNAVGSE